MGLQKFRIDFASPADTNGAITKHARVWGSSLLSVVANCPLRNLGDDTLRRTVYIRSDSPDTFFSIAAACKVKGKTIKGYVTWDDTPGAEGHVFRAMNGEAAKLT